MRSLILAMCLSTVLACSSKPSNHSHSSDHPDGHDHHAAGHGHGDTPTASVTVWSEDYELFAEYSLGVVGHKSSFLLHLTSLDGFAAL